MTTLHVEFTPQSGSGTVQLSDERLVEILGPYILPMIQQCIRDTEKDDWLRWFRNSRWFANSIQSMLSESVDHDFINAIITDSYNATTIAEHINMDAIASSVMQDYRFERLLNDLITQRLNDDEINEAIQEKIDSTTTLMANDVVEKVLNVLLAKISTSLDI